MENRLID